MVSFLTQVINGFYYFFCVISNIVVYKLGFIVLLFLTLIGYKLYYRLGKKNY